MPSLDNAVAIVTGGARGIGRAITAELMRNGASVVVFDKVFPEDFETFAAPLRTSGRSLTAVQVDITRTADVEQACEKVAAGSGRIDILVNNAAIKGKGPFLDVTEATWDEVLQVNLKGPYFLAQQVARQMVGAGIHGRIINVTSNHESTPLNNASVYSISKCGLHMLTLCLARELAAHQITVNSLIPGSYLTPMNLEAMTDPVRRAGAGRWIPLGRMGDPEDITAAAIFLASPQSDYITGSSLRVDGGASLM